MTDRGFIEIVYVTDDFAAAECFAVRDLYSLEDRQPSSPGVERRISLTLDDFHYGRVRDRSRNPETVDIEA
ncbi:hypothetical protein E4U16_001847 [Claviceps sp. LM84 group G4]|nr:hypothetical protein E4U16_001847 [Claviceps sp. LM84 group G4]